MIQKRKSIQELLVWERVSRLKEHFDREYLNQLKIDIELIEEEIAIQSHRLIVLNKKLEVLERWQQK